MTIVTEKYFENIAATAQRMLAEVQPEVPTPPVTDGPQCARATSWASRSVHPLQFLETTYFGVVQRAVAEAGNDTDKARENEFKAMSRFFALSSSEPTLLLPSSTPLIEELCRALKAQFNDIKAMQDEGKEKLYANLVDAIELALKILSRMTTETTLGYAAVGVQNAAKYIGLFPAMPAQALEEWKRKNPCDPAQLPEMIKNVDICLVQPLLVNTNAIAAPRSLYNIEAFYLFRLMHRFLGGSTERPMDITQKGIASGAATGAINLPTATWLSNWHELQIQHLAAQLHELAEKLKKHFNRDDLPIRFHLKGGRAMNVALGTPDQGTNDWDTGILIDPNLEPLHWYEAFSHVNDLVVHFLDQARFSYTELLIRNEDKLGQVGVAEHLVNVDFDDMREFSRVALHTEHLEENLAPHQFQSFFEEDAHNALFRPTGVNGELIDIGISTRNSVELREHWAHMTIISCLGVNNKKIPVPDLAYFVDDFTTMIREAIATDTVGRKLAKRLVRLDRVLCSDDVDFVKAVETRYEQTAPLLPESFQALKIKKNEPDGRLQIWLLDALIMSVPGHLHRENWVTALDKYIAENADDLFNKKQISKLWGKVETGFKTKEDAQKAEPLLIIQNALSLLSHIALNDAQIVSAAIGDPDCDEVLWPKIDAYLKQIFVLSTTNPSTGFFSLSGGLAAYFQTRQARVPHQVFAKNLATGIVEVSYHPGIPPNVDQHFKMLTERLKNLKMEGFEVDFDQESKTISLSTDEVLKKRVLKPARTTVILIRVANTQESIGNTDYLNGWPVVPTRALIRLFIARAANCIDFDFRVAQKRSANFLLKDLLGRQIQ